MKEQLDNYRQYLEKTALSENTVLSYIKDMESYCDYLKEKRVRDITKVSVKRVNEYIEMLKTHGRANSTILRSIAAIKKYYAFLIEEGVIDKNPASTIQRPQPKKKLPSVIAPREIVKILNQPKCVDLKGYRDKAMLELVYATGIKVSELIALGVKDVDIYGGMLLCNAGKNKRYIPIGKQASEALDNYIKKARPMMVRNGRIKTLFVNCSGTPLTRQGFWKILRHYADMAGIKTDINAQTLRHSFAIHLLQNGADINAVSEMLGHSDVETTRLYNQVLKDNIKKIYKKAHPRA